MQQINELQGDLEEVDGTLRETDEALQRIQQERDDLNADLLSTNAELQGHADRIFQLEGALESLEKDLSSDRQLIKELEGDYDQMVEKERALLDVCQNTHSANLTLTIVIVSENRQER